MKRLCGATLVAALFLGIAPNISSARTYTCNDLPRLLDQLDERAEIHEFSVAAMIIRFMARNPNPCVESVNETDSAVMVRYLNDQSIAADIFNFSADNLVVSWVRTLKTGESFVTNF